MNTTVGHLRSNYLQPTETFIYAYLAHAQKFKPFVITDVVQNLSAFPAPCACLLKKEEVDAFKTQMTPEKFRHFMRSFYKNLNYPTCFEYLIKERKINVLHAHFGTTGIQALKLKKKLKIPLLTSFYGIDASRHLSSKRMQGAFKQLFQEGDLFSVLGKHMKNRLLTAGCPIQKIQILHLGVDLENIPFKTRMWPRNQGQITMMYCGRLVEKKGIFFALEAFYHLSQQWPNLVFQIVGDGPLRNSVEHTIRKYQLQDRVQLKGMLSHSETLLAMQQAHIFILPSITAKNGDQEGTPTVLMEAQASGLPVVSTRHADIPEVVKHGKTGFLVPEKNSASLQHQVNDLLKHPETWPSLGKSGRAHICRYYNIHRETSKLEALYESLIGI
ncbi:MAG: colanic acid/amylovoran biosynthesis glycosyltransferase [Candidatus Latescibacterota bacterium]|jgi:colanic acid/amylovoran biosynthesis glycosyltransferase